MRTFSLGPQPDWAGTEEVDNSIDPQEFVSLLLSEDPSLSLITRGYCVVPLEVEHHELYSKFHSSFEEFTKSGNKQHFANLQFDATEHRNVSCQPC